MTEVVLIGYSGHAFVLCDIFASQGLPVIGYCEKSPKDLNPYHLDYLGEEKQALELLRTKDYFVAIGNNDLRKKISSSLKEHLGKKAVNAIHRKASVSSTAQLDRGIMVGDGCIINACSRIGEGVICNTQSVIEHETEVGAYSHIAPGAILCGNVTIGEGSFIGARSVVTPGVKIGSHVTIGAGTVVIENIPDNTTFVGNPQRQIR